MSISRRSIGRALLINENVGGHATMHLGVRAALAELPEIDAELLDVPAPGLIRRVARLPVPGLARLDLDLQPLRSELAKSTWVRRHLERRRGSFDVLHIYSQNAALLSAAELRRVPSVVSTDGTGMQCAFMLPYRDATRFTPSRARLTRRLEHRVFDAANFVVAQSEWCATSLRDDYGVSADRLRVIPFGVVVPDAVAGHDATGLPEITWVGATMGRKGGWRLLNLFRRSFRDRCRLNLVTREDVPEEPGVRVFRDVEPNDGKLAQILTRSAAFMFTSTTDTFGYAPLEAMAVGVPVIGFRCHAVPELVEDGVTGMVVDPEPGDAPLAAALERLLDDVGLRARMGAAARARVLERFDARVTTGQLLDVLAEARERHG